MTPRLDYFSDASAPAARAAERHINGRRCLDWASSRQLVTDARGAFVAMAGLGNWKKLSTTNDDRAADVLDEAGQNSKTSATRRGR